MFKKITAVLAAVLLGFGISVVAVAAPASAHDANYDASCSSLWVNPVSYETRQGNATPNKITVKIEPGAAHNEDAWAKRFGEAIEYLLAD